MLIARKVGEEPHFIELIKRDGIIETFHTMCDKDLKSDDGWKRMIYSDSDGFIRWCEDCCQAFPIKYEFTERILCIDRISNEHYVDFDLVETLKRLRSFLSDKEIITRINTEDLVFFKGNNLEVVPAVRNHRIEELVRSS